MQFDRTLLIPSALFYRTDLTDADRRVYGALNARFENLGIDDLLELEDEYLPTLAEIARWTALETKDVYATIVHLARLDLVAIASPAPASSTHPMRVWALSDRILGSEEDARGTYLQVRHVASTRQIEWGAPR